MEKELFNKIADVIGRISAGDQGIAEDPKLLEEALDVLEEATSGYKFLKDPKFKKPSGREYLVYQFVLAALDKRISLFTLDRKDKKPFEQFPVILRDLRATVERLITGERVSPHEAQKLETLFRTMAEISVAQTAPAKPEVEPTPPKLPIEGIIGFRGTGPNF